MFLIRDMTCNHVLDRYIRELSKPHVYDLSILMLLLIPRIWCLKKTMEMLLLWNVMQTMKYFWVMSSGDLNSAGRVNYWFSMENVIWLAIKWDWLCCTRPCWLQPTCGGSQPTPMVLEASQISIDLSDMD